jgi:hypothetical protein
LPVTLCANETWFLASGKTATESIWEHGAQDII